MPSPRIATCINDIKFGDADILSRAKGTSVAALASHDVVYAKAGTVHLIERTELPEKIDTSESCIWMLTQQLTQAMATGGIEACAKAVFMMFGSNAERAKDLAYRLYTIAEQKKWATEAFAYNRRFTPEMLTGACEKCPQGVICAGGCRSYNFFTSGSLYESRYCARGE